MAESPRGRQLRDLALALKAPKSSLLPLLRTLTARGYLTHDENGVYRMGAKVVELGAGTLADMDLRVIARKPLAQLSERTGEAALLGAMAVDNLAVLYLDKVESKHHIRFSAGLGERRPLHSSAGGKVMLAFMSEEVRERIVAAIDLVPYTEETIATRDELRAELARIRRDGYCLNIDQSVVGGCGIAAPIFDHLGDVAAACILGAPKARAMPILNQLIGEVAATASEISRLLGYREKYKGRATAL